MRPEPSSHSHTPSDSESNGRRSELEESIRERAVRPAYLSLSIRATDRYRPGPGLRAGAAPATAGDIARPAGSRRRSPPPRPRPSSPARSARPPRSPAPAPARPAVKPPQNPSPPGPPRQSRPEPAVARIQAAGAVTRGIQTWQQVDTTTRGHENTSPVCDNTDAENNPSFFREYRDSSISAWTYLTGVDRMA